jgi:hypothetical protein
MRHEPVNVGMLVVGQIVEVIVGHGMMLMVHLCFIHLCPFVGYHSPVFEGVDRRMNPIVLALHTIPCHPTYDWLNECHPNFDSIGPCQLHSLLHIDPD